MSRRTEYRDELDVPGEMGWDRAVAIAEQEAKQAARKLEQVTFLREQAQVQAAAAQEVATAKAEQQEVRNAIATDKAQAEEAHARDKARRGEELARLDAVIAARNEEAERATARAERAEADYQRWVEARPRPEPARA